jgi:hypothetical protein
MFKCRFINYNKYHTLVRCVGNGENRAFASLGGTWEIPPLFSYFFCESKTVLIQLSKNSIILLIFPKTLLLKSVEELDKTISLGPNQISDIFDGKF